MGTYYHEKTRECYDPCLEQARAWREELRLRYREWSSLRGSAVQSPVIPAAPAVVKVD